PVVGSTVLHSARPPSEPVAAAPGIGDEVQHHHRRRRGAGGVVGVLRQIPGGPVEVEPPGRAGAGGRRDDSREQHREKRECKTRRTSGTHWSLYSARHPPPNPPPPRPATRPRRRAGATPAPPPPT